MGFYLVVVGDGSLSIVEDVKNGFLLSAWNYNRFLNLETYLYAQSIWHSTKPAQYFISNFDTIYQDVKQRRCLPMLRDVNKYFSGNQTIVKMTIERRNKKKKIGWL
jgi:hypothetical protein